MSEFRLSQSCRNPDGAHGTRTAGGDVCEVDRYEPMSLIGKGGMGQVSAAHDRRLDRIVAQKVLFDNYRQDPVVVRSFLREALITAQLQHPNIIPIYDLIQSDSGAPSYVMKLIDGHSLLEVINHLRADDPAWTGRYSRFQLLTIFRKVCDAVAYAHSRGIIHRDIKPANIMVGAFGEVLLVDWGLAKRLDDTQQGYVEDELDLEDTTTTRDGIVKGSLAYLSPEQALGEPSDIDRQSDVFLLGATLYHLLTCQPPYTDADPVSLLLKAEIGDFPHPYDFPACRELPAALVDIVMAAMAPAKKKRFKSVQELVDRLDAFMAGAHASDLRFFAKGSSLFLEGDRSDDIYIIASGSVEIATEHDGLRTTLDVCRSNSIIGELAALTGSTRTATATAIEDTWTLVISSRMLFDEIHRTPPWLEKIVSSTAHKLKEINERIHPFLCSSCAQPVLRQAYYILATLPVQDDGSLQALTYDALVQQIADNLGLPDFRVREITAILLAHGLMGKDEAGTLEIQNPAIMKELAAFCDEEKNIRLGQRYLSGQIKVENIKLFHAIYADLTKV